MRSCIEICIQLKGFKYFYEIPIIYTEAETLLPSLEQAAVGIGLHVNAHKTEYMCLNQRVHTKR